MGHWLVDVKALKCTDYKAWLLMIFLIDTRKDVVANNHVAKVLFQVQDTHRWAFANPAASV